MAVTELNGGGDCKTYLVVSAKTREAALVDPLLERTGAYRRLLRSEGLKLRYVVDTHTHADHLSGAADLMDRLGAEYVMGPGGLPSCIRRRVGQGETLSFGDATLAFLATPGHTTDSMSLVTEGALLSGDFLFIGALGAGRLDLPGGDPAAHYESLKRLEALGDATRLLPGHDYQGLSESTLGDERKSNPVLVPRVLDAYIDWWTAKRFGPADWMKAVVRANMNCTLDPDAVVIPKTEGTCAAACASVPVHKTGLLPQISPRDLAAQLSEKGPRPFLLDVRNVEEFEGELEPIPGSVLIPLNQLAWREDEVPSDRPVAVLCRTGNRATQAAARLQAGGRRVWVLTGGLVAYRQAGY